MAGYARLFLKNKKTAVFIAKDSTDMIAKKFLSSIKYLVFLCLYSFQLFAQQPVNDCYSRTSNDKILFGNSQIEIEIDTLSGVVSGLFNKTAGKHYLADGKADIFRLNYSTYENNGATSGDTWSAGYGITIYGSKQRVSDTHFEQTGTGATLSISYKNLSLGRRTIPVTVAYRIELTSGEEDTKWNIAIDNKDAGTIREVHFPVLAGLTKSDYLIMPNHGGQRLVDPLNKLSDENPSVYLEYPARASMQWLEYYSSNAGLYMASYDSSLAYTRMYFGRQSEDNSNVAMWFAKYPFIAPGGKWQSPNLAVSIHSGDWHHGADEYRNWIESWVPKPKPPKRIVEMIAGADDLFIKDPAEKTVNSYSQVISKSATMGVGKMYSYPLLVGWFYSGHDTYYPEYYADKTQGGDSALIKVVQKLQARGIKTDAYFNGRINNIQTDTYKQFGKQWAVHGMAPGLGVGSIHFFELYEHWNKSWQFGKNNAGWFSVMCPSAKGWQDHIVNQVLNGVKRYGFDGVFFDQPGSFFAELCYNNFHGHTTPATAWGPGYLEIFKRIYTETKRLNPDFALWTEGMNDAYSQYLDYHTDKNPVWVPMRAHPEVETFAEMWRYTMPWCITLNDAGKYSLPASKDKIYGDFYRFVMGIRGVAHDFDNRWNQPVPDSIEHDKVVRKIEKLWTKGGEFFFYGRFKDDVGLSISDTALLAKAYTTSDAIAVPIWNTSARAVSFDLNLDLKLLFPSSKNIRTVTSLETGKKLAFTKKDNTISLHLVVPAHDALVVVLR